MRFTSIFDGLWLLMAALPLTAGAADAALARAEQLADWQLAHRDARTLVSRLADETNDPRSWEQAPFWLGLAQLAEHEGAAHYARELLAMGKAQHWSLRPRPYQADDQAIAQAYLWAARHGAGVSASTAIRQRLDAVLARPPQVDLTFSAACQERWCWSDALFMAPPVWLELSRQTRDVRYRRYALAEYWATVDFLYDPAERLFYRDSRFFERRDAAGHKQFWGRGNGWVFAGLARIIPMLPAGDADRVRLEALFRDMASRLSELQNADGYWPASLLAGVNSLPESSGTALLTYGLAWGIKVQLLDRARYQAAALRGWAALLRAIQPDGRLGFVQQVSDQPEPVGAADTQFYGVGAFILAALAIADLDSDEKLNAAMH